MSAEIEFLIFFSTFLLILCVVIRIMYDCCKATQPSPRNRIVHQKPIRNRVVRVYRFHTPDFGTYEIGDGPFSETEANTCCDATFNDVCNDTCNDTCIDTSYGDD